MRDAFLLCLALLAGLWFGGCAERFPDHPGRAIFEVACGRCHHLKVPLSRRKNHAGWTRTVAAMRRRGARLTDEQAPVVVEYLVLIRVIEFLDICWVDPRTILFRRYILLNRVYIATECIRVVVPYAIRLPSPRNEDRTRF